MSEAIAYVPPSREPADIAARLRGYIERNEAHAQRHLEGEKDEPKLQFGYVKRFLTDVKRLEHQMRCFILFLAAQLIERGLITPAPLALFRRGEPDPTGPSAYVRRQDREMRQLASGKVRLSPFAITTPVFEASARRRKRRSTARAIYKMMPCDIQPVDARYLLARYGRLTSTLLRADVLAERLAGRALTVKLNAGVSLFPTSDRAGAGALSLRNNSTEPTGKDTPTTADPNENWGPRLSVSNEPGETLRHGSQIKSGIGGNNGAQFLPLTPAQAGASFKGADPDPRLRGDERTAQSATHVSQQNHGNNAGISVSSRARCGAQSRSADTGPYSDHTRSSGPGPALHNSVMQCIRDDNGALRQPFNNPLYYDKLHSVLAPKPLWESAADVEDERDDLTALHWMAHEALISAGFPTGPDPKLRLPDFSKWREPDPPDSPEIHLL